MYATNEEAPHGSFHLVYADDTDVSLGRGPVMVDVKLVCSSERPALIGDYLVSFRSDLVPLSSPDVFVSDGRQQIPMAGDAQNEPGDLLGFSAAPLLSVSFYALAAAPSPSSSPKLSPQSVPAGSSTPSTPAPQVHVDRR